MIKLNSDELKEFTSHSSKGNQLKWKKDDIWYKADYTGYEGLSEYVISMLLTKSDLAPNEYIIYDTEKIQYKHTIFNGSKSSDFLQNGCQLITLSRLYNIKYNRDFTKDLWHIQDIPERLLFLVDNVIRLTNLKDFGLYLSKMLTIDALFLNEDRHLHNIAVLMNEDGTFDYCPFFDHGAGLLADTTMDYPLGIDIYKLIDDVKAKTISSDFDEALDVVEKQFGQNLHFHFNKSDVANILNQDTFYDNNIKLRVQDIIYEQMRKYQYLFN